MKDLKWIIGLWVLWVWPGAVQAQVDSVWTLSDCITHALEQNISVRQAVLNNEVDGVSVKQAKASRFPTVSASVGQNFSWNKQLNAENVYGDYVGTNGTSMGLDASVVLFNGFRNANTIRQKELAQAAGAYDIATQREQVSLNVLDAYLQVLYAGEQIENLKSQVETTQQQLLLAEERFRLGAIANADLLQVKSALASEKQRLANAQGNWAITRINLMQLMDMPAVAEFKVEQPSFGSAINEHRQVDTGVTFETALAIRPQIKSAKLNEEMSALDVKLAKGNRYPSLMLNAGLSSGYTSALSGLGYGYQVENRVSPTVGLSLSIPIYQRRQVRSAIELAEIGTHSAELNLVNTQNQLRKLVEQACTDVQTAEWQFEASEEGYAATKEAFMVADEKYKQGAINSVDYLVQKNNLIAAESALLQSKYNLIFAYKTLDFQLGKPLAL